MRERQKNNFFARFSGRSPLKGPYNVIDPLFGHFQNVETDGQIFAGAHQIISRDFYVRLPFFPPHRIGGRSEQIARARLDLAENDCFTVFCDDVRLAERRPVIGRKDPVPRAFEIFYRPFLSDFTESFVVNVLR